MRNRQCRRMCVCCGEWYYVSGKIEHVTDKMCATCVMDLESMDGPEFFAFVSDVERLLAIEESRSRQSGVSMTVEELISVMDH